MLLNPSLADAGNGVGKTYKLINHADVQMLILSPSVSGTLDSLTVLCFLQNTISYSLGYKLKIGALPLSPRLLPLKPTYGCHCLPLGHHTATKHFFP